MDDTVLEKSHCVICKIQEKIWKLLLRITKQKSQEEIEKLLPLFDTWWFRECTTLLFTIISRICLNELKDYSWKNE